MNKQLWMCGVVSLVGILLNAQDVSPAPSENLKDVVGKRSQQFVELLRRAEACDEYAQYNVANAYSTGTGVAKDSAEAVRWWLQSAQNGIAEAQNRMGYLYEYGLGVPQDFREAARYFNSAAEQKLAVAEHNLGHMYQYGQGVPRDYARAADLYGQAAARGLAPAQNELGVAYARGAGVPQNAASPFRLFVSLQNRERPRRNRISE